MKLYIHAKSIIDCLLALLALLCLWPFMLVIAVLIKLDSKGPVLFKQRRMGRNHREFLILKFRTMRTDTPKEMPTHLLQDPDFFITKIGKFLRKSSLDELPQLVNILKGEMSIIGPRPALWNQTDLLEERDKVGANGIKPGLTGWAQVNGRDELTNDVKAKLDGEYVKRMSFGFDLKIFFLTIYSVVRSEGIREGAIPEMSSESKGVVS